MADNTQIPTVDWEKGGTLHATFSFLIEHDQLPKNALVDLAEKIREKQEKGRIATVIDPMFDDISDRKRQVFSDELLVDAEYGDKPPHAMETISLIVPREIRWRTEGTSWAYVTDNGDWEWNGIECRYFWFLHSNGDLSYHVSLKMPYQHTLGYYYALALVQKLFFPSERPHGGCSLKVKASESESESKLRDFLGRRFENHFISLLKHHDARLPPEFEKQLKTLVQHRTMGNLGYVRAAFLLDDACFDHVLREREKRGYLTELKNIMRDRTVPESGGGQQDQNGTSKDCTTPKSDEQEITIPTGLNKANNCRELLALLFLSGYLQNIIDFLEQDEAEFVDGTDQLYPKPLEDDPNFLLYATQGALFEVVRESRSLQSGCRCIGTCPYLFLVHVTLFHDEALVNRFARLMIKLEDDLIDQSGGYKNVPNLDSGKLAKLVHTFQQGRLTIFAEVEKYLHLNVFLYDTEQSFYEAILGARGIRERLQHQTELISKFSETIEGFHERAQQNATDNLNKWVAIIGGLSIFQVLFAMTQAWRDASRDHPSNMLTSWATPGDFIFTVLFLGIIAVIVYRERSRLGRWIKEKVPFL